MKKFFLILLAIILVGLIAFHFIAANNAEQQIDTIIQAQADSLTVPTSVQYSSIDVSPFSGDIELKDVTVSVKSNIERASTIHIDLRYLDFLNITVSGVEYGMKNISSADVNFIKLSYLNRNTLQEASLAQAHLTYSGKLLDGIRTLILGEPLVSSHRFDVSGTQFRYSKPNAITGNFKSDSVTFRFESSRTTENLEPPTNAIVFKNIVWDPPSRFRKKYGFFIQGFGYPLDAIPFSNASTSFTLAENSIQLSKGETKTDLFTLKFKGNIIKDSTWSSARLAPLKLQLTEPSEQFKNVLSNIEQLLGLSLPEGENMLQFQLRGPIQNPKFSSTAAPDF